MLQKRYNEDDCIIKLVEHCTKKLFIESFEPLSIFIKFWLYNVQQKQYIRYVFEPECPIAQNEYNLFLGLK